MEIFLWWYETLVVAGVEHEILLSEGLNIAILIPNAAWPTKGRSSMPITDPSVSASVN